MNKFPSFNKKYYFIRICYRLFSFYRRRFHNRLREALGKLEKKKV